MKFSDLFLPKIARSDPKVRKQAIEEETSTELLAKVIANDSDPSVRQAAQNRLNRLTGGGSASSASPASA